MSTKLNPEELAENRFQDHISVAEALAYNPGVEMAPRRIALECYAAAIREHSQPIADERDELREALEWIANNPGAHIANILNVVATALSKYPKTEQR